ncbi:hypothetical protein CBR_g88791, partial [Chara braunii]
RDAPVFTNEDVRDVSSAERSDGGDGSEEEDEEENEEEDEEENEEEEEEEDEEGRKEEEEEEGSCCCTSEEKKRSRDRARAVQSDGSYGGCCCVRWRELTRIWRREPGPKSREGSETIAAPVTGSQLFGSGGDARLFVRQLSRQEGSEAGWGRGRGRDRGRGRGRDPDTAGNRAMLVAKRAMAGIRRPSAPKSALGAQWPSPWTPCKWR